MGNAFRIASLLTATAVLGCSGGGSTDPNNDGNNPTYSIESTGNPASAEAGATVTVSFLVKQGTGASATPASGQVVTIAVVSGGGTVGSGSSTTVTTGASGVASTSWHLGPTVGSQSVRGSLSGGTSTEVAVAATQPPATQLALSTAPGASVVSGGKLSPQPVVQLRDGSGNNVPQAGVTVTAAIQSGGGALTGTASATTSATGAATFTDLGISGTVGSRVLSFTASPGSSPLTVSSAAIQVTAGAAAALALTTAPGSTVESGVALSPQPVVQLRDAAGNSVSQSGVVITATIESGGGTLSGTNAATTGTDGSAAFTNLALTGTVGPQTLRFSATVSGLTFFVSSASIQVTAPSILALITGPDAVLITGVPFFLQPVIQLRNGAGNNVTLAGVPITVSMATGTGTLGVPPQGSTNLLRSGDGREAVASLTVNTDATGKAVFTDLMITGTAMTGSLRFSAPGYSAVTTPQFTVIPSTTTTVLNSGEMSNQTAASGETKYLSFTAPAGTMDLSFVTFAGAGNVQLYARKGAYPTSTTYDCVSLIAGASQRCDITSNRDGQWFLALRGNPTFASTTFRAIAFGAGCSIEDITLGVANSGLIRNGIDCTTSFGPQNFLVRGTYRRYRFNAATSQAITWQVSTSGSVVATVKNDASPRWYVGSINSTFQSTPYLIGPGPVEFDVYDNLNGFPGGQTYTLTVSASTPDPASCLFRFPLSGYSGTLQLTDTDCFGTSTGTRSGRLMVIVDNNQTINVSVTSTAFAPVARLLVGQTTSGGTVAVADENPAGGNTAQFTFTNTTGASAIYTIETSSKAPGATGAYTFSFTASPATYNVTVP